MAVALQASARKAGVEFEIVPGEHTPDFRARKFEVLVGNSGSRLPDPFGTLVQYAYNPDNRDEAKLGGYYLWRIGLASAGAHQARRPVQGRDRSGQAQGAVRADGQGATRRWPRP